MPEYSSEIVEVVLPAKDIPIGSEVKRICEPLREKMFLTDSIKVYGKENGFSGVLQEITYPGKKMIMHWQGITLIDDDFNLVWVTSRGEYQRHIKFLADRNAQRNR